MDDFLVLELLNRWFLFFHMVRGPPYLALKVLKVRYGGKCNVKEVFQERSLRQWVQNNKVGRDES